MRCNYMHSRAIQCKQAPYNAVLSIALYTAILHFCYVHYWETKH